MATTNEVPMKDPVESHTDHNTSSLASHSRDWGSSIDKHILHKEPSGLKNHNDDIGIPRRNDSLDVLSIEATTVTDPSDSKSDFCIGYSVSSKLSNPTHLTETVNELKTNDPKESHEYEKIKFASSVPDSDDGYSVDDIQKPPTYIVYSSHDDPHNQILELSDLLNSSGFNCEIDQYHDDGIVNWGQWTEKMIKKTAKQNGNILLACSPTLFDQLCSNNISKIEMRHGHISNQSLYQLITDPLISPRVVPVFLEQYTKEYIPSCLLGMRHYTLHISKVLDSDGNIKSLLDTPDFESFRSLLYRLNGEQEVIKPFKSVDISMLPSSMTSLVSPSRQMEQLQNGQLHSYQEQPHHGHTSHNSFPTSTAYQQQQYGSHWQNQQCVTTPLSDFRHALPPHSVYTGSYKDQISNYYIVSDLYSCQARTSGVDQSWYSHNTVHAMRANQSSHLSRFLFNGKFKQLAACCGNKKLYRMLWILLILIAVLTICILCTVY